MPPDVRTRLVSVSGDVSHGDIAAPGQHPADPQIRDESSEVAPWCIEALKRRDVATGDRFDDHVDPKCRRWVRALHRKPRLEHLDARRATARSTARGRRVRSCTRKNNTASTSVGSGTTVASPTTTSTLSQPWSSIRMRATAAISSLSSTPVTRPVGSTACRKAAKLAPVPQIPYARSMPVRPLKSRYCGQCVQSVVVAPAVVE